MGNFAAAKDRVKSLAGTGIKNEDSGIVAYVNSEQRKELTHQSKARISQGNGFSYNAHYAVVGRIDRLFQLSLRCGIYPDLKHGDENVRIHCFACPIVVDGERAIAWLTAKETLNQEGSERLYNLELMEIEKLAGKVGDLEDHNLLYPPAASKDIVASVKALSKTYFENFSKVVDENGEPLVVYHGTVHGGFRVFDVDGRGKTEGAGAFFTSDKRVAEGYSANFHTGGVTPEVYACFLNIREPEVIDFNGNSWNRVPDRASGYFVHYDNEKREEMLGDLEAMDAKFEMIGSYPELVAEAKLWDGDESKFADPVAMYLERVEAMQEESLQEEQDRKAAEEATPMFSWSSSLTQAGIIGDLKKSGKYDAFYHTVDSLQKLGKPHDTTVNKPVNYALVSDRLRNDVSAQTNGDVNLAKGMHAVSVSDLWHSYSKHCLDYFIEKNQLNLTYDDLRMIPDIVENYDSVKVKDTSKGYTIVYVKDYDGVLFTVTETIAGKDNDPRGTRQKTIYVSDVTKNASGRALHPTPLSKNFTRTEIINPISAYIKQNYANEARNIAKKMRYAKQGMVAPNGKQSNLSPELWLAVRLQSFKDWFGDWENDPANASKVVDENGEPLVVYHGTPTGGFTIFRNESYFSPLMWYAEKYKNPSASSNRSSRDVGTPMLYEVFLNIRKPFDTRKAAEKKIFETEFFRKWGNGAPLSERGLPDWTDASDLLEFIEENELDYDGLILDEGGYPDGDGGVILRGHSFVPVTPNQIKSATDNRGTFDGRNPDITYSVTGGKNLAAVHTLSAEKFLAAVELGGMPMPSVAVTRLDRPYKWGSAGAINLIGKPEMVDPRKKSKVYLYDAYAGMMPPVMYRKKNTEGALKLKADALEKLAPYGIGASEGLMSGLFSNDYNESVVDGHYADWGNNRALMAYWAITQAGYAPKPKMKEAEGLLSPALYKALKPWVAKLPEMRMFSDDFTEDMLEGFRAAMVGYFEGKGKAVLADNYSKQDYSTLRLQAVDFAEKVRRHTTKKVPDAVENGKRFVAYAEKRHKAFKAWADAERKKYLGEKVFSRKYVRRNWRGEVVDEWWGHEKYTLSNLMRYMREEKGRGEESASMSPGVFLAVMAEEFRSMRDMQASRDRIVDSKSHQDAREEWQKAWDKFNKLAYDLKKPGWGGYFEIADAALWRLLELVSGGRNMPSREAVEKKLNESKDGWTDEHVDAAMELLSRAVAMPSDYMEAIPQRAVKMNEWEYAVMPVGLKKNKAVVAALREHGIKPLWHDGTDEGRRAVLAGLVDNPAVSFSVIGPKAATWSKYVDRAFAGRDDGKWRAEIDASQAKLKMGAFEGKAERAFNELLKAGYEETLPKEDAQALLLYAKDLRKYKEMAHELLGQKSASEDELKRLNAAAIMAKVRRGEAYDVLRRWFVHHDVWVELKKGKNNLENPNAWMDSLVEDFVDGRVSDDTQDKLRELSATIPGRALGDILDYPELFEAYPELASWDVHIRSNMGGLLGYVTGWRGDGISLSKALIDDWPELLKTLLHEIQHVIQDIEGFAQGGSRYSAVVAYELNKDDGLKEKLSGKSDYELYLRLAGEIEARNVEERLYWNASDRSATPFNETLEYPGEALVTYSVIGPKAATWSKYVDRAFAGRDDGMLRAEIDASQAKLKWEDLRGKNVAAYRKLVAGWEKLPEEVRKKVEAYAEEVYDGQDESDKLDSTPESEFLEQYNKVQKMRDATKPKREEMRILLNKLFVEHGGSAGAVLNMKSGELDELAMSLWGPYVESKVEDVLDLRPLWHGGMRLADVMDYPELYEAYPELADVVVRYVTMDNANGRALYGDGEREISINRNLEGEWQSIHSILLHEIQHHIQNIEGFAKGGNPSYARRLVNNRAEMGDMEAQALREHSDMELYKRIAGEIEARNVQARYGWSADKRAAIPFNSTLEYPGEALVTFSMQSVTADWKNTLHGYLNNPPLPGTPAHTHDTVVCPTPAVMQMVGAKGWDMVVTPGVLDKVMKGKHAVSVVALEQLPAAMADPICIAVSDTPGCLEVVTELKEGQHNVLVAVQLNSHQTNNALVKVNRIASMYGKERIGNLMNHPMLYWNKAKARPWLASYRLQLPAIIQPKRASGRKILKPADLVKYKKERNLSFSLTGASAAGRRVLEESGDEYVANRLQEAWQKNLEKWSVLNAGKSDANSAMRAVMEMEGLVKATYDVVQDDVKLGRPYMLQRWAMVYARMVESGEIPPKGALKGPAYEKFVERLTAEQRTEMRRGMSGVLYQALCYMRIHVQMRNEDGLLLIRN